MTTTILSSKQRFTSLLGQLMRRNLSTSIYLFVIMFVFFPLQMFFETHRALGRIAENGSVGWTNIVGGSMMYTGVSAVCMIGILVVAALVLGLVQCSYLHSKRAVDLYHSLPVSRTQLMLAGLISSFATIAVPYVINYIINIGISIYRVNAVTAAARSGVLTDFVQAPIPFGEVALDLFGWLVTIFAIMAIVNLVATQVGSVFENFVFVCELLVAPALIVILNNMIYEQFLTGYTGFIDEHSMLSLTPATFMAGRLYDTVNASYYNAITLVWLVLGIAIMWAAIWLYGRRRSEIAEASGCRGIMGFVFSAVAVYLAAPLVGIVIFSGFANSEPHVYVIGVVLGAVLSFLLVEAILNRGFAGMRGRLPRGGAVCAFVIAVAVVVTTGGLGYESRVPDSVKVESVTINSRGWYEYARETLPRGTDDRQGYGFLSTVTLSDKTAVDATIAMHERLITINQAPQTDNDYWGNYTISYDLGGKELNRRYNRTNNGVDALLMQLEDTEAFQREANPVLRVDPTTVSKVSLYNNLGFVASELTTEPEIKALLDALGKDSLEQGTAPYVGGETVACYIYFHTPLVERHYSQIPVGATKQYEPKDKHFNSFSVPVFASYKHTLAQLGSNLPAKGTTADVTEVGFSSYFYDYYGGRSDRFVSSVRDKDDRDFAKGDIEAYTKQQDKIEEVIDGMVNTALVEKNSYRLPLYCVFFNGTTQGITVMIPNDAIPANIFEEFPDLAMRYQQMEDEANATANVVRTTIEMVNTKTFEY